MILIINMKNYLILTLAKSSAITSFKKCLIPCNRPYAWWRFAAQFHHHASLPCSFCTLFPQFMLVFFSNSCPLVTLCILNVRLGGKTDQQNVIMHKAHYSYKKYNLIGPETLLFKINQSRAWKKWRDLTCYAWCDKKLDSGQVIALTGSRNFHSV